MKKTIFGLSALLGVLSSSAPVLAMLTDEVQDHKPTLQRASDIDVLVDKDIEQRFIGFIESDESVRNTVFESIKGNISSLFKEAPYLNETLTKFFNNFKEKNKPLTSLFLAKEILEKNTHLFLNKATYPDHEYMSYRLNYTLGLLCGIGDRLKSGDFILENKDYASTNTLKEKVTFLATLLKNARNVDFIFLNSAYYQPLDRMDEECAGILGDGIGYSSLKRVFLKKACFMKTPDSLPALLNHAKKNKNLELICLRQDGYKFPPTMIKTLIEKTPNDFHFTLSLPFDLDFQETNEYNEKLRTQLTSHFGDKVKFGPRS